MANESAIFWVDVENNTLLTGWESNTPFARPSFKQGDNIKVELHFVRRVSTNSGIFFDEVPTAGSSFKLAIGNPDAVPTGGTWTLDFDGEQADFLYNASASSVQTALNSFASITALGGVTVEKVNGDTTYRISFNDKVALTDDFTGDATNLLPSSSVIIDEIKVGSPTVRGVWHIKPTQTPIAYQGTWTPQDPADITTSTVQSGTTRVKISPPPKEGTFVLSVGTYTTAPISVYATALEVQNAITAGVAGFEVKKSGAFIWDVSQTTTPLVGVSADGSGLISFDAVVGEINFNNYETATLLTGASTKNTTLEIEVTTGSSVSTVLQTQCTIVSNLINETIFAPTPFEEHLTPSEANALYLKQASNLSDLLNVATARGNLSVYSTSETESLLALKADLSHTHGISDVTGLQTALNGKANTTHSHIIGDVTGLQTALDGKAATSHTHTIGNITGLQTALDAKASLSGAVFTGNLSLDGGKLQLSGGNADAAGSLQGQIWHDGTGNFWVATYNDTIDYLVKGQNLTSALGFYAPLSGATFTGKVNFTSTSGRAGLNIGIGGTSTSANVAGDLWIATGGTNLNFRDGTGAWRVLATQGQTNTFSTNQIIAGSTTTAMLRVTQTGTGESLRIEDETNPDSTPFVVGADGRVGIHGTPAVNTNYKLAIYNGDAVFSAGYGISFGDGTRITSANGLGATPSIWSLQDTNFGSVGQNYEDGDLMRIRTNIGGGRYADGLQNFSWAFSWDASGSRTMGEPVTKTGSGVYDDGMGNTTPYTASYTISFEKQHPRLNTGTIKVVIDPSAFNASFVITTGYGGSNNPSTKGMVGSDEYYGDTLTITVPEANISLNSTAFADYDQGIVITFSTSEAFSVPLTSIQWDTLEFRYTTSQRRANKDDQFVTRRGLMDSFIQELNFRSAFSFPLTAGDENLNYLMKWDTKESRFKFIEWNLLTSDFARLNSTQTFVSPQTISTNSSDTALRVTQNGTGACLLVEDVVNDTTLFLVNPDGRVGIGVSSSHTFAAGSLFQVGGRAVFNGATGYAPINIGTVASTPTNLTNGDIWIGTALNFRASDGSNRTVPVLNTSNTFTANTTVNTLMTIQQTGTVDALSVQTSNTATTATTATFQQSGLGQNVVIRSINTGANQAALRVEQRGTGHAVVIEDSQNPDTSATFIDSSGRVGVNLDPAATTLTRPLTVNGTIRASNLEFSGDNSVITGGVATVAQARSHSDTTHLMTPNLAHWMLMNPNIVQIQRAGFTVTNTGTVTFTNGGWISSHTRTGTAGACSSRWRTFGISQVDQVFSMTDKSNPSSFFDFSNPAWLSGRSILTDVTDSVFSWWFYHGKAEGDGVGDIARRGFGWKVTGGAGSRLLTLHAHNGTTLSAVTSSYAVTSGVAFDWDLISDGAGTVTLYVNGTLVATSTGGPTGSTNVTPVIWEESVATSAAATNPFNGMTHSRGKLICFDP